jgi:hypothetical protein
MLLKKSELAEPTSPNPSLLRRGEKKPLLNKEGLGRYSPQPQTQKTTNTPKQLITIQKITIIS